MAVKRTVGRRDVDHRRARWEGKLWLSVAIGYLILLVSVAVALYALEQRDKERLHTAALASCERANTLRDQLNRTDHVGYVAYVQGEQRERVLATSDDSSNRHTHLRSANAFRAAAMELRFIPLDDCSEAVDHASTYVSPHAIPFKR